MPCAAPTHSQYHPTPHTSTGGPYGGGGGRGDRGDRGGGGPYGGGPGGPPPGRGGSAYSLDPRFDDPYGAPPGEEGRCLKGVWGGGCEAAGRLRGGFVHVTAY